MKRRNLIFVVRCGLALSKPSCLYATAAKLPKKQVAKWHTQRTFLHNLAKESRSVLWLLGEYLRRLRQLTPPNRQARGIGLNWLFSFISGRFLRNSGSRDASAS